MSELALQLIAENKKTRNKRLDLGNCGLTEVPEEVGELVWLEELVLSSENAIDRLLAWNEVWRFSYNKGKPNQISTLPVSIKNLKGLLSLAFNSTDIRDLSPLSELENLKSLDCSSSQIQDISPISNLINIEHLYCSDTHIKTINSIENLSNLTHLHCSGTEIAEISPIAYLNKLQRFRCSGTRVDDLSPLSNLKELQDLRIAYTSIIDLSPIVNLIKLSILDCRGCQVHDLSPILPLIKSGIKITYSDVLNEGAFEFFRCPLIIPPVEIIQQGQGYVLKYFSAQEEQGDYPLNEAKIVVVGAGDSGKTTLIKKLQNPAHPVPNEDDQRTEGVVVTQLPLKQQRENRSVTAHLWDLGGQELYHATHQFFLTADTFYILLNDNRRNDTDFYYWLNILALRAGDACPIFCIFNQKENATRQLSLDEHLFDNFPGLLPQAEDVNFADRDESRFIDLRQRIETRFLQLPVLKKRFPKYWVGVRNALVQTKEPHISWKTFKQICIAQGIPEDDHLQMEIVAQTLHNLGNLLWYPQVFGMRNLVILNSQWCLKSMYKVLDSQPVAKADGRFQHDLLNQMWCEESHAGLELQLEQLMRHFDLCYETSTGSGQFIAPQLLPLEARIWPHFSEHGSITFRHKYEFMPAGLLTRFIARMAPHIFDNYVWRKGVTLRWDDTYGEAIENVLDREITLRVCGPDRKRRLNEMRQTLETVESLFRGLKLQRLVSCNCADCRGSSTPTTFDLNELEDNAAHGDEMICRNVNRKKVPAQGVLDGIEYTDVPRVFISYSHKNEGFKDEFKEMLAPLDKTGQWKIWDDRYLLPGDEWNREILRQIAEANVIVLLLTPAFFASEYIYDIELTRAVERHAKGTALLVSVVVEDCLWEETPLKQVAILPKDAQPVSRHASRPEVWREVVLKIKEAIAARERRARKEHWT